MSILIIFLIIYLIIIVFSISILLIIYLSLILLSITIIIIILFSIFYSFIIFFTISDIASHIPHINDYSLASLIYISIVIIYIASILSRFSSHILLL